MSDESKRAGNIGFWGVLFFIFLVLKLTGVIDWSWWWVTAPLWGSVLIALAAIGVLLVINRSGR